MEQHNSYIFSHTKRKGVYITWYDWTDKIILYESLEMYIKKRPKKSDHVSVTMIDGKITEIVIGCHVVYDKLNKWKLNS